MSHCVRDGFSYRRHQYNTDGLCRKCGAHAKPKKKKKGGRR